MKRDCSSRKQNSHVKSELGGEEKSGYRAVVDTDSIHSCEEDEWISDSGATCHMTFREDWFNELMVRPRLGCVSLGKKAECKVIGIDIINILKSLEGKWLPEVMRNVLFVPDLQKSIFSE